MSQRTKITLERGKFKQKINTAIFKDKELRDYLIGDMQGKTKKEIEIEFKKHVKSHLFIDDTITDTGSFIFYDITMPLISKEIKKCKIVMYILSHRDSLFIDTDNEKYYGNHVDILSEMVENCLLNDEETVNSFGIGQLKLDSVDFYNNSKRFYGLVMVFDVPNFRCSR